MDIKKEIKNDVWQIMKKIYLLNEEKGRTEKQEELLEKIADYMKDTYTVRRRKEKVAEAEPEVAAPPVNPDSTRW